MKNVILFVCASVWTQGALPVSLEVGSRDAVQGSAGETTASEGASGQTTGLHTGAGTPGATLPRLHFGGSVTGGIREDLGKALRERLEIYRRDFPEEASLSDGMDLVDDFACGRRLACAPPGFAGLMEELQREKDRLDATYSSYEVRVLCFFALIKYPDVERPKAMSGSFEGLVEELSTEPHEGPDPGRAREVMMGAKIAVRLGDPHAARVCATGEWTYHVQGVPRAGCAQKDEVRRLAMGAVWARRTGWEVTDVSLRGY